MLLKCLAVVVVLGCLIQAQEVKQTPAAEVKVQPAKTVPVVGTPPDLAIPTVPAGGGAARAPGSGNGKIVCPEATWKFGTVPQATSLKHEFKIKNEGTGTLKITHVQPSCQCTATMPKKTELAAGEDTVIETTLNTQTFQGPLTKNITVSSDDPRQPQLILTVTGEVLPPYVVKPRELTFGKIPKNKATDPLDLTVTITRGSNIQIKDMKLSSPMIELTSLGKIEEQEDGSRVLRFKAKLKDAPVGLVQERINVITDAATLAVTQIPVLATVEGDVRLEPSTFNLGRVKAGEVASKDISIQKHGAADLKIEGLQIVPAGPFTAKLVEVEAGKSYSVRLEINPDAPAGYHRGTLNVRTNCPGETNLQAFFYAYVGK